MGRVIVIALIASGWIEPMSGSRVVSVNRDLREWLDT